MLVVEDTLNAPPPLARAEFVVIAVENIAIRACIV